MWASWCWIGSFLERELKQIDVECDEKAFGNRKLENARKPES